MSIAAVVLAAGEATRFGSPKQQLLLPEVLERLGACAMDEIVVVEGAHPLELPMDTVSPSVALRIVRCAEWTRGPGASLRCGLAALDATVEAAVVVLADGPDLSPRAVGRVLGEWRRGGGVVAASYAGKRGHPLVLGRDRWNSVPDTGLHGRPVRLVACDDLGAPGDVDERDDLPERLRG
jgi:CTP:molybdopterin cytidylyltransferase MocA